MLMYVFHGANTCRLVPLLRLAFACRLVRCGCKELFALAVPFSAPVGCCMHMLTGHVFE